MILTIWAMGVLLAYSLMAQASCSYKNDLRMEHLMEQSAQITEKHIFLPQVRFFCWDFFRCLWNHKLKAMEACTHISFPHLHLLRPFHLSSLTLTFIQLCFCLYLLFSLFTLFIPFLFLPSSPLLRSSHLQEFPSICHSCALSSLWRTVMVLQ